MQTLYELRARYSGNVCAFLQCLRGMFSNPKLQCCYKDLLVIAIYERGLRSRASDKLSKFLLPSGGCMICWTLKMVARLQSSYMDIQWAPTVEGNSCKNFKVFSHRKQPFTWDGTRWTRLFGQPTVLVCVCTARAHSHGGKVKCLWQLFLR